MSNSTKIATLMAAPLMLAAPASALAVQDAAPTQPSSPPATGQAEYADQTKREPVQLDPQTGRPLVEPARPGATETAEEAAARMYLSGRSLLQAQASLQAEMGTQGDPRLDDRVSFFAVPEPEPTIIQKHDLVTVIVREESSAKTAGKTDLSKEMSIDARLQDYLRLDLSELSVEGRPSDLAIRGEAGREFQGDGKVDRKDSMVARITAEVLDVKPNGTLVLQARKRIATDEEEQVFILTGTCRTLDITADNTVLSTQLHDLNLEKQTSGAVRDATRRGFISRVLDRINPF